MAKNNLIGLLALAGGAYALMRSKVGRGSPDNTTQPPDPGPGAGDPVPPIEKTPPAALYEIGDTVEPVEYGTFPGTGTVMGKFYNRERGYWEYQVEYAPGSSVLVGESQIHPTEEPVLIDPEFKIGQYVTDSSGRYHGNIEQVRINGLTNVWQYLVSGLWINGSELTVTTPPKPIDPKVRPSAKYSVGQRITSVRNQAFDVQSRSFDEDAWQWRYIVSVPGRSDETSSQLEDYFI